jgi:hypothetical protein
MIVGFCWLIRPNIPLVNRLAGGMQIPPEVFVLFHHSTVVHLYVLYLRFFAEVPVPDSSLSRSERWRTAGYHKRAQSFVIKLSFVLFPIYVSFRPLSFQMELL